jgi:hypothetical protein
LNEAAGVGETEEEEEEEEEEEDASRSMLFRLVPAVDVPREVGCFR